METTKKTDYSYQEKAAKVVLRNALSNKYTASVLAATPGSGKTTISQICVRKYLSKYPSSRVVVLTEGQSTLKTQFIEELDNAHIDINFTYSEFTGNGQVRVGLPQSINRLDWNEIDLLVVDEAHNFYNAPTVQNIIEKYNVKHQILLTGSPSEFTRENNNSRKDKYGMFFISAEDLMKNNVFSQVDMDVMLCDTHNSRSIVSDLMSLSKKRKYNTKKIMVACPSIRFAKQMKDAFEVYGRKVSLSTSENDPTNQEIANFKNDLTDVLLVVNKGILGFNDKGITLLLDLKSSSNLDASNQLFSRVLRKHPRNIRKAYIRTTNNRKSFNKEVGVLHKLSALMNTDVFKNFDGKNLKIKLSF